MRSMCVVALTSVQNVYIVWLCLAVPLFSVAFNVDTEFPLLFKPPIDAESYFGYSVSLLQNVEGQWLLVGAPKGNRSSVPQLVEPGTLYKCRITDVSLTTCTELKLDSTGNQAAYYNKFGEQGAYWEKKDEGWLGVSLDVNYETNLVATCAHRWINEQQYRDKQNDEYYPNGACYLFNSELNPSSTELLLPLIEPSRQVYERLAYYAFGMSGLSAHFTQETDNTLLIGAPGIHNWIGGVSSFQKEKFSRGKFNTMTLNRNRDNGFMYLGYAVSSGKLYSKDTRMYHLIGAPRYQYIGAVFDLPSGSTELQTQPFRKGFQLGEYFGAALCTTDVNNDKLVDLLVGAPFHAAEWDEGIVYLYMNDQLTGIPMQPAKLYGSNIPGARFGMAISCLNDINYDDLSDVAIGAPYENDQGAVYIFYGQKTQPFLDNVQRIEARSIDRQLRGFGISLSRSRDIDRNNYPDIAIGSYSSGHAVVLRGRPVVTLHAELFTTPTKISISNPKCEYNGQKYRCFELEACIQYRSPKKIGILDVKTQITIDSVQQGENPRGNILMQNQFKSELQNIVSLTPQASRNCETYMVYMRENIKNYLLPITIKMDFEIESRKADKFCGHCPVLHPKSLKSVQKQVMFLKGCGDDEQCNSDLKLTASVVYEKMATQPEIHRGLNQTLSFNLTIENFGDAAFLTELNITLPEWSYALKRPSSSCVDLTIGGRAGNTFKCDVGNPLLEKKLVDLELTIDVKGVPSTISNFEVHFEVTTLSDDKNREDNVANFNIDVKMKADITIWGRASVEFFNNYTGISDETGLTFSHNYEVRNLGPSPLPKVEVKLEVPYQSKDQQHSFLNITYMKAIDGSRGAQVTNCRGAEVWHFLDNGFPRNPLIVPEQVKKRKKRDTTMRTSNYVLNPDTAVSKTITCDVISMAAEESVKIEMDFMLFPHKLRDMKIIDKSIDYVTKGQVAILDSPPDIQPINHKPDNTQVTTTLDSGKVGQEELPIWVLPVSIIAGVLLLAIVLLLLYKFGFFQRADRDKLQKMKRESAMSGQNSAPEPMSHSTNQLVESEETPTGR